MSLFGKWRRQETDAETGADREMGDLLELEQRVTELARGLARRMAPGSHELSKADLDQVWQLWPCAGVVAAFLDALAGSEGRKGSGGISADSISRGGIRLGMESLAVGQSQACATRTRTERQRSKAALQARVQKMEELGAGVEQATEAVSNASERVQEAERIVAEATELGRRLREVGQALGVSALPREGALPVPLPSDPDARVDLRIAELETRLLDDGHDGALEEMEHSLSAIVDLLGERVQSTVVERFASRVKPFQDLTTRLYALADRLDGTAEEDETVSYYAYIIREQADALSARLSGIDREVFGAGVDVGAALDLQSRIEQLKERIGDRAAGSIAGSAMGPLVQHHLRPLVDDLIRELVSSAVAESAQAEEGSPVRGVCEELRRILSETIELEVIEVYRGDELDEQRMEEVEVLAPPSPAEENRVAELVEHGFAWLGGVIVKAKVKSYRATQSQEDGP